MSAEGVPSRQGWPPRLESALFLLLVCLETTHLLYLTASLRLVTYDTLNYFFLQYYFFNNAALTGEIAQWIPQVTHGTPATFWQVILGVNGILASALLNIAPLFKGVNFLAIFYAGILWDRFLLLTGIWLLGRRCFSSPLSIFFVAVTVMSSSLWMTQVWFNFHFYYAIPLILHLGHAFLDSGKWRYGFGAVNLLGVQMLGNCAYFLPIVCLTILLYFLFYAGIHWDETRQSLKRLRWGIGGWGFLLGTALTALCVYSLVHFSVDKEMVFASFGRGADATVGLKTFLTYGGNTNLSKWLGLFLPFSVDVDHSLYIGVFAVPFLFIGLITPTRKSWPFLLAAVVLLLFSVGTCVSIFLYQWIPGIKYYRHIALVSSLVRIFLCLLAGFGFDGVLRAAKAGRSGSAGRRGLAVCVFLMAACALLLAVARDPAVLEPFFLDLDAKQWGPLNFIVLRDVAGLSGMDVFNGVIRPSWMALFFSSLLVAALCRTGQRFRGILVGIILAGHVVSGCAYMAFEGKRWTLPLGQGEAFMLAFQQMPFMKRRPMALDRSHPRWIFPKDMKYVPWFIPVQPFLFYDQLGTDVKVEFWLNPLDQLMKVAVGYSLDQDVDVRERLIGEEKKNLLFPSQRAGVRKFSGLDEEKVQFFSAAHDFQDIAALAKIVGDENFSGDMLLLQAPQSRQRPEGALRWTGKLPLSRNQRLAIPYTVERFDANHFDVTVRNPSPGPAWMMYSDVWHPWWKAFVNGDEVPVYRANLAYKAVKLKPGENHVKFYFHSGILEWLLRGMGWQALAWVLLVLYWMAGIIRAPAGRAEG
ncbi:MAG: hypothetical protein Q8Q08_02445 [Candidatus Omnitrophota bacterium]|nr:hypothetical protein [Candidatus Omnitrophota bacterium]